MGPRRRRWSVPAAALAVVLAAGACASGDTPTAAPDSGAPIAAVGATTTSGTVAPADPAGPATGPARPSAGCRSSTAPAGAGAAQQRTMDINGQTREFRQFVPAGVAPGTPLPLVLDIHGLGGTRDREAATSAWETLATSERIVVVAPQALGPRPAWDIKVRPENIDQQYLVGLIEKVQSEVCIDASRVYANGISMGGITSSVLVCLSAARVAAVGLVSGILWKPGCESAPPRPAVVFWGRRDCVLPWTGGLGPQLKGQPETECPAAMAEPVAAGNDGGFPPVEQVVGDWAEHNGCGPAATSTVSEHVEKRAFRGCDQRAVVDLYVISDGGHTWPGSAAAIAQNAARDAELEGIATSEIDATKTMWAFFEQFQLSP